MFEGHVWGDGGLAPADVFLSDGLLANRAVQDAVERLQEVMVGVDLVQVDRDCAETAGRHTRRQSTKMLR